MGKPHLDGPEHGLQDAKHTDRWSGDTIPAAEIGELSRVYGIRNFVAQSS